MNTEDLLKSKEISTFEKLVVYILQDHIISTAKDLASLFDINEVTAKKALSNLKKAGLIKKEKVAILLPNNEKGSEKATFDNSDENSKGSEITTFSDKKVAKKLLINKKGSDFTTFSEKHIHIYINKINSINNINSINSGKLSLTSFASASLEDYTVKNNFVNDPDHIDLNQIKKDQTTDNQNFELTPLSESLQAPAKRKRAKAQFIPPTAEQVEEYMKQYVEKKSAKIPKLLTLDIAVMSEKFIATYTDNWSEVKNWKNKSITWLCNQTIWNKNQKGYAIKRRKNQDAIEEIFGKGLEPETNIIDAVQTENADGSVSYDASLTNQIQPAEEAELSAAEYIEKFKKGEIK